MSPGGHDLDAASAQAVLRAAARTNESLTALIFSGDDVDLAFEMLLASTSPRLAAQLRPCMRQLHGRRTAILDQIETLLREVADLARRIEGQHPSAFLPTRLGRSPRRDAPLVKLDEPSLAEAIRELRHVERWWRSTEDTYLSEAAASAKEVAHYLAPDQTRGASELVARLLRFACWASPPASTARSTGERDG